MGQPGNTLQQRRIRRRGRGIPVQFRSRSMRGNGYIKDLTPEGLFVCSHPLPRPGEQIVLRIPTVDKKLIKVGGMVWWTTAERKQGRDGKPGFGVRLFDVPLEYHRFLSRIPPE